jgi:hypothetical protein
MERDAGHTWSARVDEAGTNPTLFDWVQVLLGLTGPIVLAVIGLGLHRATNRLEHRQWTSQKVIERRLQLFDQMAPLLNRLYCYMTWSGRWKEDSPRDMVEVKRRLDELVYTSKFLVSPQVFTAYRALIGTCFMSNWRPNRDALLLTTLRSELGDRRVAYPGSTWQDDWDEYLMTDDVLGDPRLQYRFAAAAGVKELPSDLVAIELAIRARVRPRYDALMAAFAEDLEQIQTPEEMQE